MSVYARRRLIALCIAALIIGGGYALLGRGGGSSSGRKATSTTQTTPVVSGRPGGQELAAAPPTGSVPLPDEARRDPDRSCAPRGRSSSARTPVPGGMVALTFDDGPGPDTSGVLEELQREHARRHVLRDRLAREGGSRHRAEPVPGGHADRQSHLDTSPARSAGGDASSLRSWSGRRTRSRRSSACDRASTGRRTGRGTT